MKKHLQPLTSLRFFAAALIVLHHTGGPDGYLPYAEEFLRIISASLAVSFFFVLSGFILYYSYEKLKDGGDWRRFIVSRFARIWPAHLATLIFVLLCFPYPWGYPNSQPDALNFWVSITLLHAWVPFPSYYFSFNGPSWSLSVELFFYVCFPLLIYKWNKTWHWKLGAGIFLAVFAIVFGNIFNPPELGWGENGFGIGFIKTLPVARLFEFALGMTAGWLWLNKRINLPSDPYWATAIEFYGLALVIWGMHSAYDVGLLGAAYWGRTGAVWVETSGCAPIFAIFIFIVASARGLLSKLLSLWPLVFLGEISFSLYLTHVPLIRILDTNGTLRLIDNGYIRVAVYWVIVILISSLVWKFVEVPARSWLLAQFDMRRNRQLPGLQTEAAEAGKVG